jgi:hypothetical protein
LVRGITMCAGVMVGWATEVCQHLTRFGFGVPPLLGAVAVLLLWRATANVPRLWIRVLTVAVQALIGFAIYMAACLWYVIETGVDCL